MNLKRGIGAWHNNCNKGIGSLILKRVNSPMNERMTELEEKTISRLLCWDILCLQEKVKAKWNNPCALPPVKLYRTDRRIETYGVSDGFSQEAYIIYKMTCCGYKSEGCVPEAYIKVIDDIENGKIL